jgi:hypothetical protein
MYPLRSEQSQDTGSTLRRHLPREINFTRDKNVPVKMYLVEDPTQTQSGSQKVQVKTAVTVGGWDHFILWTRQLNYDNMRPILWELEDGEFPKWIAACNPTYKS